MMKSHIGLYVLHLFWHGDSHSAYQYWQGKDHVEMAENNIPGVACAIFWMWNV